MATGQENPRWARIRQQLFRVLDSNGCDWEDEYEMACSLVQSSFHRVPYEAREFILEKFMTRDLPEAVDFVRFECRVRHRDAAKIAS